MNYARTALLLAVMTALFGAIGYLIGGAGGMVIGLFAAVAMNGFAYWNADRLVLRMYRARPVERHNAPELFGTVQQLCSRAKMPLPKLYVIDSDQPNAFATGRSPRHAAVAVTTGLLRRLNQQEIAGVLAHELAHIKNRDTLIMTITATLAGAVSMIANFAFFFGGSRNNPFGVFGTIVVMLLAPIAAALVQMAISRAREYEADRVGAQICGHPLWLASALERIEAFAVKIDNRGAEANPATAHLFIINPLHAHRIDGLFSTHPRTVDRVRQLREMARIAGLWS